MSPRQELHDLRQKKRLRQLLISGVVDSFGLFVGWTVFNLHVVERDGLHTVGLYNALMLFGIAISAPFASWLSSKLDGRRLLRSLAIVECGLRVGTFLLLLGDAPTLVIGAGIALMNIIAWTGYAGMRAEVAATEHGETGMTRYMVAIAGIEAVGAGLAAVLPRGSSGVVQGWVLVGVIVLYGAVLAPTYFYACNAIVKRRVSPRRNLQIWSRPVELLSEAWRASGPRWRGLVGGAAVMFFASGMTLLSVGLTAEIYGPSWVGGSAAAFTVGCLLATRAVDFLSSRSLGPIVTWSLWGFGMAAGWTLASVSPWGLLFAQFLSGLSMSAFEGMMDARTASDSLPGKETSALASAAAARAFGSAIAVGAIPTLLGVISLTGIAGFCSAIFAVVALLSFVRSKEARRLSSIRPLPVRAAELNSVETIEARTA